MVGFSGSDWASSDSEHRRSMTEYSVFLCGGPIAWRSCLQTTVAKLATEAEYYALSNCIDEVTFMKQLLLELGIETETIPIYEDNKVQSIWLATLSTTSASSILTFGITLSARRLLTELSSY